MQQIPYTSLQKSFHSQFKDLAFFQILKRKGPYISRSVTKIQNDLFNKHKLSNHKTKNLSFIKDIRLTLAAYQIIINQIKNDFLLTQLDSLGDSIHKLFTQMITIITFFSSIILNKQKLAINDLIDLSLQQLKEKQLTIKKMEQEQKTKSILDKQRQNQLLRQIQRLNFNFRELFKAQNASNQHNKLVEDLWKAIVLQNKNNVQKCLKFNDSDLTQIIQDSCDHFYYSHAELDNFVRVTKQEIFNGQKALNGFTDKTHLIQENSEKIEHMKSVATQIVDYAREKVYQKKNMLTQTMMTMIDNSRVYITTKQLDEKRKMQVKIKNFEKSTKEKQGLIDFLQKRLKQAEDKLRIYQDKYDSGKYESDSQEERNIRNHNIVKNFISNISRTSKQSNFISFKISPTSKVSGFYPKPREGSFTVAKNSRKSQKNMSINYKSFNQKSSKRSSSYSKELLFGNRSSQGNQDSIKDIVQNEDFSFVSNPKSRFKKFYKIRDSSYDGQSKSFKQASRLSHLSKLQNQFNEKIQLDEDIRDSLNKPIIETKSFRSSNNSIANDQIQHQSIDANFNEKNPFLHSKSLNFTIIQSVKVNIRPKPVRRYLQSAKKNKNQDRNSNNFSVTDLQTGKQRKSISHNQISRYFFQPLNDLQRHVPQSYYRQSSVHQQSKKRASSSKLLRNSGDNILSQKKNTCQKSLLNQKSNAPELNAISFVKLKNQKMIVSSGLKQNQSILKNSQIVKASSKKQSQKGILKKSSVAKQSVSFGYLPKSAKKRRQNIYSRSNQNNWQRINNRSEDEPKGEEDKTSSRLKCLNERINQSEVIHEQNEGQA